MAGSRNRRKNTVAEDTSNINPPNTQGTDLAAQGDTGTTQPDNTTASNQPPTEFAQPEPARPAQAGNADLETANQVHRDARERLFARPVAKVSPPEDGDGLSPAQEAVVKYVQDIEAHRITVGQNVLGTLGQEPPATHQPPRAVFEPVPTDFAPPGALYGISSSYIYTDEDIFASTAMPAAIEPRSLRAASVTADAAGDKIIRKGQVVQLYTDSVMVVPHVTGTTAFGICNRTVNLRDGDQEVGIITAGYIREDRCRDNAVYGTVLAQTKLDLPRIVFMSYDL